MLIIQPKHNNFVIFEQAYKKKMTSTKIIIISLLLSITALMHSQSIVDVINKTEKAAFESHSYNSANLEIGRSSGFLLSADGMAITMGSIFEKADSAEITLRNGRSYEIERVISIHPQTNMALVKIEPSRQRDFSYLLPSKRNFRQKEELLIFASPLEVEDGMVVEPVVDIVEFPFVSRTGILNGNFGAASAGAPAVNSNGELCGIVNVSKDGKQKVLYTNHMLNDSNWVNINVPVKNIAKNKTYQQLFNTNTSQALLNIVSEEYIEAAKSLSKYIRANPKDDIAISLRAYARYFYDNMVGCRDDMKTCMELNPNNFLQYYFQAIFDLEENKRKEARINLDLCLARNSEFAPAITKLAMMNLAVNKDIRLAYSWLNHAIECDSLYSKAYYERARLLMRHSDDEEATLKDINKSIELDPGHPGIYTIRGTIELANDDFLAAIRTFDRAIEMDVNDVHAYFNRGVAQYNIGLNDKACEDWRIAGKLGNYDAFNYITRYCKNAKRNVYDR